MRILVVLPGLHRYERGAEVALTALANGLVEAEDDVTMIGSGLESRPGQASTPYRYIQAGAIARERFESLPSVPIMRSETVWEEASFVPGLLQRYRPGDYDLTVTCAYPFTNWALRRPALGRRRPPHVFITQNGDWPAFSDGSEYRWFGCEGLVCTNPDFYERNRAHWPSALIPNGIDTARFTPGFAERDRFGLPIDRPVVLMVSALIDTKRVADGIRAVSAMDDAHLVVAGDGPLRDAIDAQAASLLPGRFSRITVRAADMPVLYRSADAFLHLSLEESFGNVYLEAMACGLPVVAPDDPRVRWIVGDDEHLVDTADPRRVADAISRALSAPADRRDARVRKAGDFAWAKIVGLYRDFFRRVVSGEATPDARS